MAKKKKSYKKTSNKKEDNQWLFWFLIALIFLGVIALVSLALRALGVI